jgi:hypothetical protein
MLRAMRVNSLAVSWAKKRARVSAQANEPKREKQRAREAEFFMRRMR